MIKIEEVDGEELVKKFAEEMERMLGRKMESVKVKEKRKKKKKITQSLCDVYGASVRWILLM